MREQGNADNEDQERKQQGNTPSKLMGRLAYPIPVVQNRQLLADKSRLSADVARTIQ